MADRVSQIDQLNSLQDKLASNKSEIQRLRDQQDNLPDTDAGAAKHDEITARIRLLEQNSKTLRVERDQVADKLSNEDDFKNHNNIGTDAAVTTKATQKTIEYSNTVASETTTGGATRTVQLAPLTEAQQQYQTKYAEAREADLTARQAANQEYLEKTGQTGLTGGAKLRALREAEANGLLTYPPKQTDALGEPPPGAPPIVSETPPVNQTTVTSEERLRVTASNQTAAAQPTEPGTETPEQNAAQEPLSDKEANKINSAENSEPTDPAPPNNNDGPSSDDAASTTTTVNVTPNTSATVVEQPKVTPNPLHEYATYTYGITLFILSKDDYRQLQEAEADSLNSWKPTNVLISSGGRRWSDETFEGAEVLNRNPEFNDDFYFDNLRMQTVVGMNSRGRGTNAIDIGFTIIEPYGMTLLDRLIVAAVDPRVGSKNYLEQPYLLQIDFFGSRALGEMETPIPQLTKRIPIKLIEMKIKAGTKGAEYAIKAIPFNHSALQETVNTTPANFEIAASTVGDFFKNEISDEINQQLKEKEKARADAILARGVVVDDYGNPLPGVGRIGIGGDAKALDAAESIIKASYKVNSYTGAVNAWYQKLVDNQHATVANSIEFAIDPEIANSSIVVPTKLDYGRVEMTPVSDKANQQGNNAEVSKATPAAGFNSAKKTFNINAGTSIVDVINMVMQNSKYIKEQVIDPLSNKVEFKQDQEVKFFKIIPQIIIKDFDPKTNIYAKTIRYHVVPYVYYNTKHPNLPYAIPTTTLKEYNYIYTGKNTDIIDFSIDFDTAFYTSIPIDREKTETNNSSVGADEQVDAEYGFAPSGGDETSIARNKHVHRTADLQATPTGADDANAVLSANVMKSIYSNSRGDMINVKLKILGDPHFIKQDDVYANPGQAKYDNKKVMLNDGTIAMDSTEIFCRIQFQTPVDMENFTGLPRIDKRYSVSKFSGIYKILTIDNEFSRGQFVQTLDAIRMFGGNKKKNEKRPDTGAGAGQGTAQAAATDPRLVTSANGGINSVTGEAISPTETAGNTAKEIPQPSNPTEDMFASQRPELTRPEVSDQSKEESDGVKIAKNLAGVAAEDVAQYTGQNNTNPESAMYI